MSDIKKSKESHGWPEGSVPDARRRLRRNALALALTLALAAPRADVSVAHGLKAVNREDLAGLIADPRSHARDPLPWSALAGLAADHGAEHLLPPASRADIPVGNCNDSGPGSLRHAVTIAASGDRVDARGLGCGTITLTSGALEVSAATLTIIGPGRDALTIRNGRAPSTNSRVVHHVGNGVLTLSAVTIADGDVVAATASPDATGGCILSSGTVVLGNLLALGSDKYSTTVRDCRVEGSVAGNGKATGGAVTADVMLMGNSTVSGSRTISHGANAARFSGGAAIFARSRIGLVGSHIHDNHATGIGKYNAGAIMLSGYNQAQLESLIADSTIAGNSGLIGGGALLARSTRITNSTFSGNVAAEEGGGLIAGGLWFPQIKLINSTVTANRSLGTDPGGATAGGVVAGGGSSLEMHSSLIAGNFHVDGFADDLGGQGPISGSNNLLGVWRGSPPLPPGTIIGGANLMPLAANGGRTPTHALAAGSLAINAGSNTASLEFDQRGAGFPRVRDGAVDIGAVEYIHNDVIFADGFQAGPAQGAAD